MHGCPDEVELLALVSSTDDGEASARLRAHLDGCSACQAVVGALLRSSVEAPVSAVLQPGEEVGRFVVEGHVASGAMGDVYRAVDPTLGRPVALKLLRGSVGKDERSLREARAMARLAHPNVVAVYELGERGPRAFLAMEWVEGVPLSGWLSARTRGWKEVLAVFLAAADGLGAAHAAGVVHRDFKPDNVLVGADGRVRVTDFGLASLSLAEPPPSPAGEQNGGVEASGVELTRSGALVGTPAYMAPEQLAGARADERSDQFSFCVALYEALFGVRPFRGTTVDELRAQLHVGPAAAPAGRRVPAWLRRVVARGLTFEPKARFASLGELAAALRRPLHRRRRWVLGAVALLVAVGAGAGYFVSRSAWRCAGGDRLLSGRWDEARRGAARAGLLATGLPWAEASARAAQDELDRYAARWVAERREACEASHKWGEQSELVLQLRLRCLDRKLHGLDALAQSLATADAKVAERAVEAAYALDEPARCRDAAALLAAHGREPEALASRAALEQVRADVERARGLSEAGRFDEAESLGKAAAASAQRLKSRLVEAEGLFVTGLSERRRYRYEAAGKTLHEALLAAMAGGNDPAAFEALVQLTYVEVALARYPQARSWVSQAAALVEREGGQYPRWEASQLAAEGRLLRAEGKYLEAEARLLRASELVRSRQGPDHPDAVGLYFQQGDLARELARPSQAIGFYEKARAALSRTAGAGHPSVARAFRGMSSAALSDEKVADARRYVEQALEVAKAADEVSRGDALNQLAGVQLRQEDHAGALASLRESLALRRKNLGEDHPVVGQVLHNIGLVLMKQGRVKEAVAEFEAALALYERRLGPTHPHLILPLVQLGEAHLRLNQRALARHEAERALALANIAYPEGHPNRVDAQRLVERARAGGVGSDAGAATSTPRR